MAFISTYARNKRDPSRVTFEDPRLESITGPTYGVAVYQEQLMAISRADRRLLARRARTTCARPWARRTRS